ncbi:ADM_collapsed_G0028500.mRNA.1.CDS.1 [Saccharomyces cerevisiae]|nr:ADM_collapsed_G0028500.mRNA.1.CDS.1 [Saccharomyces cerevisiae]
MTTFQKTFPTHCTSSEFTTLIRPDFRLRRMTAFPYEIDSNKVIGGQCTKSFLLFVQPTQTRQSLLFKLTALSENFHFIL